MADPEFVNVQHKPKPNAVNAKAEKEQSAARHLGEILTRDVREHLASADQWLNDFAKEAAADKSNTARAIQDRFAGACLALRGKISRDLDDLPPDLAESVRFLTEPPKGKSIQSARLMKLGHGFDNAIAKEDRVQFPTGKSGQPRLSDVELERIWSSPEARVAVKEMQRMWKEIKPVLEKLTSDPRTITAYLNSSEGRFSGALERLRKHSEGENPTPQSTPPAKSGKQRLI